MTDPQWERKVYRTNAIVIIFHRKKPCDGTNFDCAGLLAWDITGKSRHKIRQGFASGLN